MKYLKFEKYDLLALGAILIAICLRLFLISQRWPLLDSDEGTMGVMAIDIAYHGSHPIFFYGQHYMGVLQAYLAAAMFHLFGVSSFSLRLGLVLLDALFLSSMYILVRMLYSRSFAIFTSVLLAFGSYYMLEYQLHAYGGYPDTMLFGTLAFVFASRLAITSSPYITWRRLGVRLPGYAGWGFVVGLGLWSDQLILPVVATSGLLILLFCWRELLRVIPLIFLVAFLSLGGFPLIYYNLHAAPGLDSWTVLWELQHGGSNDIHHTPHVILQELKGTIQTSIPTMTGNPFCPVSEEAALHDPTSPHTLSCTIIHSTWGLGYLLLLAVAGIGVLWATCWALRRFFTHHQDLGERQNLARQCARLMLLASGIMALVLFASSSASTTWPGTKARYLTILVVVTPSVLWLLWHAAGATGERMSTGLLMRKVASRLVLIGVVGMYMVGSVITLMDIPRTQTDHRVYTTLINHLLGIGATHIYTDYWTCDKVAFMSQEKIICGVINSSLQADHSRDMAFYNLVHDDAGSSYVFPPDKEPPGVYSLMRAHKSQFRYTVFGGYNIYQPILKGKNGKKFTVFHGSCPRRDRGLRC